MEKTSELLMQSIMADFGITEEEMTAMGEGAPVKSAGQGGCASALLSLQLWPDQKL